MLVPTPGLSMPRGAIRRATCALLMLFSSAAAGHGALTGDADTCVLAIGPYKMHFTGYQPGASGNEEFCEDIPKIGQTIIVLESMDLPLRDMDVGVQLISAADDAVVLEQPMRSNARGAITLMHNFPAAGGFVGYVTVRAADLEYIAEFPFSVGLPPAQESDPGNGSVWMVIWMVILGAAVLLVALVFLLARRRAGEA